MSEFLSAYNSADVRRVVAFFERHGSGARSVERANWVMGFLYPGVRRFVPEEVTSSSQDTITLRGRSDLTDAWYRFTIEIDSQPPHGVAFGFENDEAPSRWSGRNEDVASYLKRLADADFFSGAVIIADNDRVLHSAVYGDVKTIDTQINLGSANKMFTAVAIMQLVEQGRVRLDGVVGEYIPDYPNREVLNHVTIRQLLTHTSGVGDFFNEKYMARKKELRSVVDLLSLFATDSLEFRPGAKWQYSNGGYVVLGRVIELVSGMPYEQYVQRHVFAPAGMKRTSGDARDPYARGHTFTHPDGTISLSREVNDFAVPGTGSPAGGGYSTVGDLVSFVRALRGGRLVSKESFDLMITPHVKTDRDAYYGYGFEIATRDGETVFGHNGHHLGISAQLSAYRQSGRVVAVLSNYDPPTAPVVAARLGKLAPRCYDQRECR